MSTDITAAFAAIRARAESQITTMPLAWQDEVNQLPDAPAPFVYFEMVSERGLFLEVGGGRGANRHRNNAELHAYCFFARGEGLAANLARAEPVAVAFRSWRSSGVSFDGASVHPAGEGAELVPEGVKSAAENYTCVVVIAPFHFDQTA